MHSSKQTSVHKQQFGQRFECFMLVTATIASTRDENQDTEVS